MQTPAGPIERVIAYHERTKHHPFRFARSLGYLDWDTQPDPFRRYEGAEVLLLDEVPPGEKPPFDAITDPALVAAHPVDRAAVERLLYDSLALSAWKEFQGHRWSLRVNPSSGNLHPTEGYLMAGPVPGLSETAVLCHYAPFLHALEVRARPAPANWEPLAAGLPRGALLLGLTSIHWRESWKYGERAFRYCHHDAGHALAAVAIAAALLGWEARLLDALGDDELAVLLGVAGQSGIEAEHPDALLVLWPRGEGFPAGAAWRPPREGIDRWARMPLSGTPNRLSEDHHPWPVIDAASEATARAGQDRPAGAEDLPPARPGPLLPARSLSARGMIRGRRSAVAMDGRTRIGAGDFFRAMEAVMPARGRAPFEALPWAPAIHLALFVHRVDGLEPGLYLLPRTAGGLDELRGALSPGFSWVPPPGCPRDLPLHLLRAGDFRETARHVSCTQEIASDGVFALGMLAEFEPRLRRHGAWFYRRLHWEAGAIGQVLYLEAEAAGIRSTGIGCFFDDTMHEVLGLRDSRFQTIYHFTVGGPVEDRRLRTVPAYAHRARPPRGPGVPPAVL